MAVQAQYPSNVLFLNRGVQEQKNTNDYSLQPQPGGEFLDQTHMLFNNTTVVTNTRKRGREIANLTVPKNSLMSMQSQPPPQLIDLTQLHNPQTNVVSTGLRLAFGDQQLQQRQRQQQQHSLSSQSSVVLSLLSKDLATQIKQQRDEIDHFLQVQGEQMTRTLAETRQRHYRALLRAAEESAARRLREKEAEAEKAARRNAELEARAAQLCAESQAWQARARAVEATAATLQAQLQHAIMSGGCAQQQVVDEDEGTRLTCGGGEAEDAESGYVDPDRVVSVSEPCCKACRTRVASVVLLPCRHLCVCKECDGVIQACPLCLSFRSSSVEVCLS